MTEYQIPGRVPDDSTPRDAQLLARTLHVSHDVFFEDYEFTASATPRVT